MSNSRNKASSVRTNNDAVTGRQYQSASTERGEPLAVEATLVREDMAEERPTQHIRKCDLFMLHLCMFIILI